MTAVARVELRDDGGYLSVPVQVGGQTVRMIVDTGSEGSLMTPEGVSLLRLAADPAHLTLVRGAGGDGRMVPNVLAPEVGIGGLGLGGVSVPVGALPGSPRLTPPIVGLLGGDVLSRFDVEFDVPGRVLTLWSVRLGSSVCRSPPAWGAGFMTVPVERVGHRMWLGFVLDGHEGRALLDSGARSHIVSVAFVHRMGISDADLGRDAGGTTAGVDLRESVYHWHRFGRLQVGDGVRHGPVLTVAPLGDDADMLLGSDWFARRRVWVSYAADRVFAGK